MNTILGNCKDQRLALLILNVEMAMAAIEATPAEHVDLNFYEQKDPCGTLHCSAGILAGMRYFRSQGIKFLSGHGNRHILKESLTDVFDKPDLASQLLSTGAVSRALMREPSSFRVLFDTYAMGVWDSEILEPDYDDDAATAEQHKELALARFMGYLFELYAEADPIEESSTTEEGA